MELLREITEKDAYPNSQPDKASHYKYRKAVRAVVFDGRNNVALLHVSNHNYYKLPGGGIENGEEIGEALNRECLEEAGCNVTIIGEVGSTIEYRDRWDTKQESWCYLAKLKGEKGIQNLQGYEIDAGFKVVWVGIDEAIKLIKNSNPDTYDGPFIVIRDTTLLTRAKNLWQTKSYAYKKENFQI